MNIFSVILRQHVWSLLFPLSGEKKVVAFFVCVCFLFFLAVTLCFKSALLSQVKTWTDN